LRFVKEKKRCIMVVVEKVYEEIPYKYITDA
jgi:hypothetical protein